MEKNNAIFFKKGHMEGKTMNINKRKYSIYVFLKKRRLIMKSGEELGIWGNFVSSTSFNSFQQILLMNYGLLNSTRIRKYSKAILKLKIDMSRYTLPKVCKSKKDGQIKRGGELQTLPVEYMRNWT